MMAARFQVLTNYNMVETILSIGIAISVTAVGFSWSATAGSACSAFLALAFLIAGAMQVVGTGNLELQQRAEFNLFRGK